MTYAIHRVAEEIKTNFRDINKIICIEVLKKMLLKAPYQMYIFKTVAPGISLPPEITH